MSEDDSDEKEVTIRPEDLGDPGATTFSKRKDSDTEDDSKPE